MGDGVVDGFGGGLEEVGEADVEAAFAQADGGVERGEAAEADVERGDGRAGAEFAVLVFEDGDEGGWVRGSFWRAAAFGLGGWRVDAGWSWKRVGRWWRATAKRAAGTGAEGEGPGCFGVVRDLSLLRRR